MRKQCADLFFPLTPATGKRDERSQSRLSISLSDSRKIFLNNMKSAQAIASFSPIAAVAKSSPVATFIDTVFHWKE